MCNHLKEYSIVEHIKYAHNITTKQYRELFPDAPVKSEKQIKIQSEQSKKKWQNDEFKNNQIKKRKITHTSPEFRKKMSDKITKIHKETPNVFSGLTNYHKTNEFKMWVTSESRIDKIRKTTKDRWADNTYRERTINSIKKSLNDGRCAKSVEFRENMSKKISKLYADGVLTNSLCKYKTGKYENKNGDFFIYASSYELDAMIIFDNSELIKSWTNKHGIRIKYYYNNLNRNYVPDFLVNFNNGLTYIIEMKGWKTEEVEIKEIYIKKIYPNYKIFYNIEELKKFIDENK